MHAPAKWADLVPHKTAPPDSFPTTLGLVWLRLALRGLGGLALWLGLFSPFVALAYFVRIYAVAIPHWDDWETLQLTASLKEGTLNWSDLVAPHCEHRWLLPRLASIGLTMVSGADVRVQNYVGVAFALGAGIFFALALLRTVRSRGVAYLGIFVCNLLLASPTQWQTWLWPSNMAYSMVTFALGFGTWVAARAWEQRSSRTLVLLALAGLFATLSFSTGLASWCAFGIPILGLVILKKRLWPLGFWVGLTALTFLVYFLDLENRAHPSHTPGGDGTIGTVAFAEGLRSHPGRIVTEGSHYALSLLGGPFARGTTFRTADLAPMIGLGFLGLLGFVLFSASRAKVEGLWLRLLPWLVPIGYSLACAFLITIGRLEITSANGALLVRYIAFMMPGFAGLFGCLLILAHECGWLNSSRPRVQTSLSMACGGFLILTLLGWQFGNRMMQFWWHSREQGRALMLFHETIPWADFYEIEGDPAYLRTAYARLVSHGYLSHLTLPDRSVRHFRLNEKPLRPSKAMIEVFEQTSDARAFTSGFALLSNSERPADLVVFTIGTGADREVFDVVQCRTLPPILRMHSNRDFEFMRKTQITTRSFGDFEGELRFDHVPPGTHAVEGWMLDRRKMTLYKIPGSFLITKP